MSVRVQRNREILRTPAIPTIRSLVGVWLTLLVLLVASVTSAYVPLGIVNTLLGLAIAAVKVGLIASVFMHLRHADNTVRVAAAAALFFLWVMAFLSFGDFLTRVERGAQWQAPRAFQSAAKPMRNRLLRIFPVAADTARQRPVPCILRLRRQRH